MAYVNRLTRLATGIDGAVLGGILHILACPDSDPRLSLIRPTFRAARRAVPVRLHKLPSTTGKTYMTTMSPAEVSKRFLLANNREIALSVYGKPIEIPARVTRRISRTVVVGLAIALVSGSTPQAQKAEGPAPNTVQAPQITFRSGVEVVTISATVRDRRRRVIKDLTKEDFEILDTGARRAIRDFHSGEAAVSLALLLDISGSMAVGGNMDRARQAVNVALGNLRSGFDEAALFTFDSQLQEIRGFTTDLERITSVSLKGKPFGMT